MGRCLLTVGALLLMMADSSTRAAPSLPAKGQSVEVEKVDALVAAIDKKIQGGKHSILEIEHNDRAMTFKLYYEPEPKRLAAAMVSVGNELWLAGLHCYFYPDGKLMKYATTVTRPPNHVMVLDHDGAVLSKNVDAPSVSAAELVELFDRIEELSERFATFRRSTRTAPSR